MAFWRPGSKQPDQNVVVDTDRGNDDAGGLFIYNRHAGASLRDQRERLPIFKYRTAILYLVETHATTIIMGQTGSGKTTQIPQYLAEAGWALAGREMACTQPRRLAVQSVAMRVAEEMGVKLGAEVGYAIRFENVTTPGVTRIKFLTDGVLLREMMEDPLLTRYSVVMVDEAHERSTATDILLGLLKKIQRRRPDLRVIVASATLEADRFASFFDLSTAAAGRKRRSIGGEKGGKGGGEGDAQRTLLPGQEAPAKELAPAILSVEGRMYPVRLHYLEEPVSDYVRSAIATVLEIHKQEPPGDILVFLTGQEEVETAVQELEEESQRLRGEGRLAPLLPLPLYAGLPRAEQDLVLAPPPRGKRRVIIATNVAETSVTLEGVVYVVDCGFSKQRFYNPLTDADALVAAPISQASALQRAGRAGRVRPGKCFRLYTEDALTHSLPASLVPEIQRTDLAPVVLQLKALGIDNAMRFDWPSPPPPEAMVRALELLFALGALDEDAKLTRPLGMQMAEIPLEPKLARMLLAAGDMGCTEEAATVAACLCVQSVWASSRGRHKEFDECRERFAAAEGDHVTFLNVFKGFGQARNRQQWCYKNCLDYRALTRVGEVRAQLVRVLQSLGLPLQSCASDTGALRRAVTAGFFANAARLLPHGDGLTFEILRGGAHVHIHPSSVLFRTTPKWVVYNTLVVTDREYIRDVAAIDSAWLIELAPHFYQMRKFRPE